MNSKSILAIAIAMLIAGSAQAEPGKFRKWLHDKTASNTEEVQPAHPLTVEEQACNRFYADLNAGRLPINKANEKRDIECQKIRKEQRIAAASTTSDPKTLSTVEVQGEKPRGRVDGKRVAKEAGKGCAVGAIMSLLTGRLNVQACAAAALGAGMSSIQHQLAQAREVEAAAKAAGGKATVKTTTTTNDKGKAEEKLEVLTLDYKGEEMAKQSPLAVSLLDKLAAMAKADKAGGLTFIFTGPNPVCQVPIQELTKRGALQGNTVVDRCGSGDYGISISPVPDVR